MLSRHPLTQTKQKHELCNCSLIQTNSLYSDQDTSSLADQREVSQFGIPALNSHRFNPKYSFNRQKTSLRGSRIGKEKQNPKENATAEVNHMHSPMKQSSLMSASNSFSQDKEWQQRKNTGTTTCKTSIFFKRITLPVQTSHGRYRKEEEQCEITKTKKQFYRNGPYFQVQTSQADPSMETLKLSQISNETQYDYVRLHKNLQTEDHLSPQKLTQYHSQHAEIASQGGLTQYSQHSPLLRPKRRTKIFHNIQQLKFKSTESIDDADSIEVSEVISDIVDSQSLDNLSEQRLPPNKRLSYLMKTRFSRMGERQQ